MFCIRFHLNTDVIINTSLPITQLASPPLCIFSAGTDFHASSRTHSDSCHPPTPSLLGGSAMDYPTLRLKNAEAKFQDWENLWNPEQKVARENIDFHSLHRPHVSSFYLPQSLCILLYILLAAYFLLITCMAYSSTLKKEGVWSLKPRWTSMGLYGVTFQKVVLSVIYKMLWSVRSWHRHKGLETIYRKP
jgi:hypothetical protein